MILLKFLLQQTNQYFDGRSFLSLRFRKRKNCLKLDRIRWSLIIYGYNCGGKELLMSKIQHFDYSIRRVAQFAGVLT